ncbi:MAG: N-acetyltransferase [Crocinitomicaceae bacterium]|nr:N-acetyltransferase [Crocinitomicaceae bacterium]
MARLQYGFRGNTMFIMNTNVSEELKGQGERIKLAKAALYFTKESDRKITLLCPFVSVYVRKHPECYDFFDRSYHPDIGR